MNHNLLSGIEDSMQQALAPLFASEMAQRAVYIQALRNHDWSASHSDSIDAAQAEREAMKRLKALQREHDPDFEMWNALCPVQCRDGREYA